jgi:hypothetical protein
LELELLLVGLDTQGTLLFEEQMDITLRDIALKRATSLGMLKEKRKMETSETVHCNCS